MKLIILDNIFNGRRTMNKIKNKKNVLSSEVGGTWCIEENVNYPGNDLTPVGLEADTSADCQELCQHNGECKAFTWNPTTKKCFLKNEKSIQVKGGPLTAGDKFCGIQNSTQFHTCSKANSFHYIRKR